MSKKQPRTLTPIVSKDLGKKMVLLAGPRQCGKTALAKGLASKTPGSGYYNYDFDADRRKLVRSLLDPRESLWIFDEIHKWPRWRNWLKGIYDHFGESHQILVTGSGRLDLYHRRGDSLAGRYFLHHLHPFTLAELMRQEPEAKVKVPIIPSSESADARDALAGLLQLSGFPEPFLSGSATEYNRWSNSYQRALLKEDFASLEAIRNLDQVELMYERLPQLVGSPLSLNSLSEDIQVSFKTARSWVSALERVYACFRIAPFGSPRIKAVKKEQKLYLWDWARVEKEGPRLENLVAVHLKRWVDWLCDVQGEQVELRYFRTTVGHEVDFIILRKNQPWVVVEVKTSTEPLDKGINYFCDRHAPVSAFQIHLQGETDVERLTTAGRRVRCVPAHRFLLALV